MMPQGLESDLRAIEQNVEELQETRKLARLALFQNQIVSPPSTPAVGGKHAVEPEQSGITEKGKHIMLSYPHDKQDRVLWLREGLIRAGFKVCSEEYFRNGLARFFP